MKTYIIHVKDAYDREEHMQKQLEGKNLDATYVTDGDKSDLTSAIINKYFSGEMAKISNATSCAYKHILAYESICENDEAIALILEDDIKFYPNFEYLHKFVKEIKERKITNVMVSLEDSIARYIPRSKRVKGTLLYPEKKGRLAGAYLVDREFAKNMLAYIEKNKVHIPIDWMHNMCSEKKVINMYWSQPAIATQGSLDGSIKSLIDSKEYGGVRAISFRLQRAYKKFLYFMR